MITLNKLAEQVELDISGGDKSRDSELERPDVILKLKQALGLLVSLDYKENVRYSGTHDVSFHYIYVKNDIQVLRDDTLRQTYSTIPSVPLQLPGNKGLKEIHPTKCPNKPFKFIRSGSISGVAHLIQDEIICWGEGNRIIYSHDIRKEYQKVTMKLICVTPETLGDNDTFFLPEDVQAKAVMMVKEWIANGTAPQDKVNDNNPQI